MQQRSLGTWPEMVLKTIADIDNDDHVDLIKASIDKPNYISSVVMHSYLNQSKVHSANCFATTDPNNPDGCAFVTIEAVDLTDWTNGQWVFRQSLDAVDVNGDGNRDLAILKLNSGGNATTPIAILNGHGDGSFAPLRHHLCLPTIRVHVVHPQAI